MISQKQFYRVTAFLCVLALALVFFTSSLPAKKAKKQQRIQSTNPALRMKWFGQHQEMKKNTPFKDLKWQHVGPRNVSGRCTDIAVITPKGKNYTIYVATASGGVWKTENEGTTWEPIFDQEASTSIGDVTLAPSNNDIMFIGTGEPNIFRSSMAGSGVYKSTDAGKTWQHMGLTGTHTIARIVIHPKNPDVVYVAASGHEWTNNKERGVYKTVDGGKNWERILYVDEETGANDLIMDPTDSNTLYASTWQRMRNKWNDPRNEPDYKGSGVYKTNDGGKTWKPINKGLPEPKFRGRIGIDLCLSKPNVVYAFVDSYEFGRELTDEERASTYGTPSSGIIKGATVYRSDDKGESWTEMSGNTEETKRYMMRHSANPMTAGRHSAAWAACMVTITACGSTLIIPITSLTSTTAASLFPMTRARPGASFSITCRCASFLISPMIWISRFVSMALCKIMAVSEGLSTSARDEIRSQLWILNEHLAVKAAVTLSIQRIRISSIQPVSTEISTGVTLAFLAMTVLNASFPSRVKMSRSCEDNG
jgi:photosystem II stability/assembly factor-like uncharacterized protein